MSFRMTHLLRWALSFFTRQKIVTRNSVHHALLEVSMVRGKTILDGASVNYSFGGLHEVFAQTFTRLDIRSRDVRSVLLLGLGAGSVIHLLRRDFGVKAPITALEIDAVMVEIAREHFELERWANLEVVVADAVAWTANTNRRFDLVVVDLFDEAEVPAACRTREFLETLEKRLNPGGMLAFNVVASRPAARDSARDFAGLFSATLGETRVLEVRGNLILVFERPHADSLVADGDSRRYSPRRT
ncbi:MAG: fused MFS/spermidine synthase [Planctomycetota bacterium]|nr:fused MFS/spermidine synthase [Planctomycetota bacterium]